MLDDPILLFTYIYKVYFFFLLKFYIIPQWLCSTQTLRKKIIFIVSCSFWFIFAISLSSITVGILCLHKSPFIVKLLVITSHNPTVIWRWLWIGSKKNIDSQAILATLIWNPRRSNSVNHWRVSNCHRGKILKSEILTVRLLWFWAGHSGGLSLDGPAFYL